MKSSACFDYFLSAADSNMRLGYQKGLSNALQRFGVDQVVLKTVEHQHNEDTYVVLARLPSGIEIGGIRIEIKSEKNRIPLEKADTHYQRLIQRNIDQYYKQKKIVAEICGLWSSPLAKGMGLGPRLAFEATQLSIDLGADLVVSMLPKHTLEFFTSLGFVIAQDVPPMAYPDDRYISTVVWYHVPDQQKAAVKVAEPQFSLDV